MEWTGETQAADWIVARVDDGAAWGESMHGVVPRGFEAYVRVLHPPTVSTLPGGVIPTAEAWARLPATEQQRLADLITVDDTTWAEAARAFGTTLHPLAQWPNIVRAADRHGMQARARDGRQFDSPPEGDAPSDLLAAIVETALTHTATPTAGSAAIWEGWGGLLGYDDRPSGRVQFSWGEPGERNEAAERTAALLGRSTNDPLKNIFRKPVEVPGILSDAISRGPRLELPARNHVLFHGDVSVFADATWPAQVPWTDPNGWSTQSPSLVWPDDRAWVVVTEVDAPFTVVGGSRALIDQIAADARLEAFVIAAGARLSHDGDEVNR